MPVNLKFEMAVLGEALQGGQSATIEAVPGSLVPIAIALSNLGDTPVDLAYIYSTPRPENFIEMYFPAWAIVSTVPAGSSSFPQLMPGQNIQAVANFRIPDTPGQTIQVRFEAEAFILPSGQSVFWSKIVLTLKAQVFHPGPPPPPSITPGIGVPIWLFVLIPGLLLLPIVLERDREGQYT